MARALIVGGTSDIGQAVAARLAARGYDLYLTGRRLEQLEDIARDLRIRYEVTVRTFPLDVRDAARHPDFAAQLTPPPDVVVMMAGYLGDNARAETDPEERRRILETNYNGPVSVIAALVPHLREGSVIAGISSVAGERPRASLYYYGSAKRGFSGWLDGLRMRLRPRGIHVITVKPGVVATKMTAGLAIAQSPLTASPEKVAGDIVKAIRKRKNTLYTPWFWRWVMLLMRMMPEFAVRRMKS